MSSYICTQQHYHRTCPAACNGRCSFVQKQSLYFPSKIIHYRNFSKEPLCTYSTVYVWRHYFEQEPYVSLPAHSVLHALSHFTLLTAHILLPELSAAILPKRATELNPFPKHLIPWSPSIFLGIGFCPHRRVSGKAPLFPQQQNFLRNTFYIKVFLKR